MTHSVIEMTRARRASAAAQGERCRYGSVIKADAPGFKHRRWKAQRWRQAGRLETNSAHVDHIRTQGVEALVLAAAAKARINGEQQIPHPAICGAGDDSERWVGI